MKNPRSGRLRWGVLAPAAIAEEVVPGLQRSGVNKLVAVASRSIERARAFADRFEIPDAHGSYDELLARSDIDCVYICVPNSEHARWIRTALQCGKHVLSEKPMTPTAAEAKELFALASSTGLTLAEAFMYRYHPKTLALGDLVRSAKLGRIQEIRSSFNYWATDPESDIRFRPELVGGALYDVGCYCVSMSNYLLDSEPESGHGYAVMSPLGVDERYVGTLSYSDGAFAQFHCSMRSPLTLGVSVLGEMGEATVAMPWYAHKPPHTISVGYRDGRHEKIEVTDENAYFYETEAMGLAVVDGRPLEVPGSETVRTLRTLELLQSNTLTVQTTASP